MQRRSDSRRKTIQIGQLYQITSFPSKKRYLEETWCEPHNSRNQIIQIPPLKLTCLSQLCKIPIRHSKRVNKEMGGRVY